MEITFKKGRKLLGMNVSHDQRGNWIFVFGAYRATWPATGAECDRWVDAGRPTEPVDPLPDRIEKLAKDTVKPGPWRTSEPPRLHWGNKVLAPLDGEETISMYATKTRNGQTVAANVWCTSRRCESTGPDGFPVRWLRAVIQFPGSYLDPRMEGYPVFKPSCPIIEGRAPAEVLEEHREWHRATWPESDRVKLDRWIDRNRDVAAPKLSDSERAELDRQLSIARAERDGGSR